MYDGEFLWFPMRVTYGREMRIKQYLDGDRLRCFLPMRYVFKEYNGERKRQLVPAVSNLIFVKSTVKQLNEMKRFDIRYSVLRFIMRDSRYDGIHEIMTIPEETMENFMRVTETPDDGFFYLEPSEYVNNHVGKKVTITGGPFAGVHGIIKRVKNNKRVVVQLEGILAAAIDFVPNNCLIYE